MKIKIKIKEIRKNRNITLKELSKKSGISTTHINDIENNLKSPGLFSMIVISQALKVDINDLFDIEF